MKLADGPGDRWPRAIGTGGKSGHRRRRLARAGDAVRQRAWGRQGGAPQAARLLTPGDVHAGSAAKWSYSPQLHTWTGGVELSSMRCGSVTESATENIPPAEQHGGIAQEKLRDGFAKLVRLARVKRWGKSPPSR